MNYTLEHQIKCLEAAGYLVEFVTETDVVTAYHNHPQLVDRKVYKVTYKGESMCEWKGFGTRRVEECFKQEFNKRLSRLLFGI